jgi:uncharacterized repeat protein (TIGR01451 family)
MTNVFVPGVALRRLSVSLLALAALLVLGFVVAQNDSIAFEVEIFRVDQVRTDDGEIEDRFVPVEEAIPGEVIEYRVTAINRGDIIYRPGTVVVTLPIGSGLEYVEDSASPTSERYVTEFSADGGRTFSEPPVLIEAEAAAPDGQSSDRPTGDEPSGNEPSGNEPSGDEPSGDRATTRRAADPSEYDAIRWTFSVPFEPEQEEVLVYRVKVM